MAVEASGAGIFESRIPSDGDTYVSDHFAEILGMHRADLQEIGDVLGWLRERASPDDADYVAPLVGAFLSGRIDRLAADMRIRSSDGQWIDVSVFAKAVARDESGAATQIVGVIVDVSERRRLEAQFRHAQKMEAVGRLAGGVAHDFNNLLTGILGFAGFALRAIPEDHPAHADLKEVIASAQMAETVTRQLLAFARNQPSTPRVLAMNTVVADMQRLLGRLVGADVAVAVALHPDLWNVRMDPGSLEQVLANLTVNARDAMPLGGQLTIATENLTAAHPLEVAPGVELPPREYATLSVSDSGVGMDEATRSRIFEPFFTTKSAGKGTGLGLSTCYGIVQQAGGYISVYSEVGCGTTFRIYLPRVSGEEDATPPAPSPVRGGQEVVLVVEDDDRVREIAKRVLVGAGYHVLTAPTAADAVRIAGELTDLDLLLTDVVMPEMRGPEVAEHVRRAHPGVRVLYMSGYTRQAIERRGELEPGDLLQKPFTPDQLATRVRDALDE
jgi:signal transduction histidine kinase